MDPTRSIPSIPGLTHDSSEGRVIIYGVSWNEYTTLRDLVERPNLRMTYLEGTLELMTTSREHELWRKNISRFLELYAHLKRIPLYGYGSLTYQLETKECAAEADQSYCVNRPLIDAPDIALEVIYSAPRLDKLEVYARLGVAEVWVFKDGAFLLFRLDREAGNYVSVERSRLLPGFDLTLIATYAMRTDTPHKLHEYAATLE